MKKKHFDFVVEKFNLKIDDYHNVYFKDRCIGTLNNWSDDCYLVGVLDKEDNIIDKGAFMNYLRIKEMKFKKLEVEERLKKLKGDFK